nr:BPI fold-containing family B member 4-like [Anolis sagrei ordinatus]
MRRNRMWAKAWHMVIIWSLLVPSQGLLGGGLLGLGSGAGLLGTGIGGDKGLLGTGLLGSGGGSGGSGGGSSDTGLLGTGIGGDKGLLGTGLLASGGGSGEPAGGTAESSGASADKSDDSGKGGLLTGLLGGGGGGLLGGGGGGDGGLLGGLLGNGSLLGGGAESGGGGLLGGVLGEKGLLGDKGLLGKDGLLNLGGEKGLLGGLLGDDKGLLGGLLGDKGLLGGLLGEKGLLGGLLGGDLIGGLLGSGQSKEPFKWFNLLNLEIVRGSWKILRGTEMVLNFQTKCTLNLPGLLRFMSGSSAEMNVTAHLAFIQNKPGDLKLELKNCKDLVGGFSINMPKGLIGILMNGLINTVLHTLLPTLVCPLFQIWFTIINLLLHLLNDIFLGLPGQIISALSSVPLSTGQFTELDFKDKPFPGAFLQWLLNPAGRLSYDPAFIPTHQTGKAPRSHGRKKKGQCWVSVVCLKKHLPPSLCLAQQG